MSDSRSATAPTRLPLLDEAGRATLFTDAHTAFDFTDEPVSEAELLATWHLAQWPPTSSNCPPLRVTFLRSAEAKARRLPHLNEGNRAKSEAAAAVAALAADVDFHEHTPYTASVRPEMYDVFDAQGRAGREEPARFNASLQCGYFLLAVRAHGLTAGPMTGFDAEGVTDEFHPGGRHRVLLVINIGHPGENAYHPRLPRLDDADVVTVL